MNNYQRLGDYIEEIDVRNTDLAVDTLLGVSISKEFIPSVANTVGTNMKRYKVIEKNQFACSIMQIRRDKKMPIALLKNYDKALVSQAYPVFKVKDENILLPDYLMMWFSRSEFDRQATFWAIGGVRGSLEWEDFLDFEIPVPSIEKQQMIVDEYNAITKQIKLNEQLNQKLEQTAQSLYKHWFVDFEFPNEQGKPYKSNGGEMVYNAELDKEIPKGWEVVELGAIIDIFDSQRVPLSASEREKIKGDYPYYGATSQMDSINDYLFDGTYILMGEDGSVIKEDRSPFLQYVWGKFWVNNHAHVLKGKNDYSNELIYLILQNSDISGLITGGVQAKISQANLKKLSILVPNENKLLDLFSNKIIILFKTMKNKTKQNIYLKPMKSLLLSKMSRD